MRMLLEHHYDQDVETVYALITDPDFLTRKYTALGGKDVAVDRTDGDDDDSCEVVTKRTVTVDLPGFAKRVMTPNNTAIQTENWAAADSGVRLCTYHVDIQGMPSKVTGTLTLTADGAGTKQKIDADVKVSIPLIGGKLEKFAIETGTADIGKQVDFTIAELNG